MGHTRDVHEIPTVTGEITTACRPEGTSKMEMKQLQGMGAQFQSVILNCQTEALELNRRKDFLSSRHRKLDLEVNNLKSWLKDAEALGRSASKNDKKSSRKKDKKEKRDSRTHPLDDLEDKKDKKDKK